MTSEATNPKSMKKPITVLVVDDSRVDASMIARGLEKDPYIKVVGISHSGEDGLEKVRELKPQVISLDIVMPGINGLEFIKVLRKNSLIPVVAVSGKTERGSEMAAQVLHAGAFDLIPKPGKTTLREFHTTLRTRIKLCAQIHPDKFKTLEDTPLPHLPSSKSNQRNKLEVIAIGASTGGIPALSHILKNLPPSLLGLVIVQHLLPEYMVSFASTLDHCSSLKIKMAQTGDLILPGTALLAPGDQHMKVSRDLSGLHVKCSSGEKYNGHRPSVDLLFKSVATASKKRAMGILLSGMGADGAVGLLEMREAGAQNLAQDESTSVVYGMPKAAADIKAVHEILPIQEIPLRITQFYLQERD
jgi:two-component system, chemotaxis family, protein-glutamate methylesterase/glutaminase